MTAHDRRPHPPGWDEDALFAGIDLLGRSGCKGIDIGYLDDDVPVEAARWYATVTYKGAKVTADEHRGPVEAVEALARRILDGGMCAWCAKPVTIAGPPDDPDVCRWSRTGARWERGCLLDPDVTQRQLLADGRPVAGSTPDAAPKINRAQRRADKRRRQKNRSR